MPSMMWINSYSSGAFDAPWKAFDVLPDTLPEKCVYPIPHNYALGNAPLDDLWYWFVRETQRALCRSLIGVELENVSPLGIVLGHLHNENQDAAICWWPIGQGTPWFDAGAVTENGGAVIDQTAETDLFWIPITIPEGVERAYFKIRGGTQDPSDIAYVRIRLYATTGMNGALPSEASAFYALSSPDGGVSALSDRWIEFSPLDVSVLNVADTLRQGWVRVSGFVATAGDFGWVSEVLFGLREGI